MGGSFVCFVFCFYFHTEINFIVFISTLLPFSNTYKQHQTYHNSLLFLEIDELNLICSKYFQWILILQRNEETSDSKIDHVLRRHWAITLDISGPSPSDCAEQWLYQEDNLRTGRSCENIIHSHVGKKVLPRNGALQRESGYLAPLVL